MWIRADLLKPSWLLLWLNLSLLTLIPLLTLDYGCLLILSQGDAERAIGGSIQQNNTRLSLVVFESVHTRRDLSSQVEGTYSSTRSLFAFVEYLAFPRVAILCLHKQDRAFELHWKLTTTSTHVHRRLSNSHSRIESLARAYIRQLQSGPSNRLW